MLGKGLLLLLGLLSLGSWGTWGAIVLRTSPDSLSARFFFFALLLVSAFFTASLLVYYLSLRFSSSPVGAGDLRVAIWCGIPPAVAITVAGWLQSLRVLGMISGLIILGAALLAEPIMVLNGRKNRGTKRIKEAGN